MEKAKVKTYVQQLFSKIDTAHSVQRTPRLIREIHNESLELLKDLFRPDGKENNRVFEVLLEAKKDYHDKAIDTAKLLLQMAFRSGDDIINKNIGKIVSRALPVIGSDMNSLLLLQEIMGVHSGSLRDWFAFIPDYARSDYPVMITGESGTGKEIVAQLIHFFSKRAGESFVTVNCGGIPSTLMESELLGIKRGTATDVKERPGAFKQASKGTLFLDEIGDMAMESQVSILRVLNNGEFVPVGGDYAYPETFKGRIISATNKDYRSAIEEGHFREDLYYRLSAIELYLSPLRENLQGSTLELNKSFFERTAGRLVRKYEYCPSSLHYYPHDEKLIITKEAAQKLSKHSFPGNYRELENILCRAIAEKGKHSKGQITEDAIILPKVSNQFDLPTATEALGQIKISTMSVLEIEDHFNKIMTDKISALLERHKGKGCFQQCAIELGMTNKGDPNIKNRANKFIRDYCRKYGIDHNEYK